MIETLDCETFAALTALSRRAAAALEHGAVLIFPKLPFDLEPPETRLVAAGAVTATAKNISYDPVTRLVKGAELPEDSRGTLAGMMARFGAFADSLVHAAAPGYRAGLKRGRTSFRPAEIAGRENSWRKDDRRRHVDAFPSTPTGGARILRVFANIDQKGTPRRWKIGPGFEDYAKTFLPKLTRPFPGTVSLMAALGITKAQRTIYDQTMLGLHDAAKRDMHWQETAPAEDIAFAPGAVWMVYTDQVPHAAISGANALEQTFYVAAGALYHPDSSPLGILGTLTGQNMSRRYF